MAQDHAVEVELLEAAERLRPVLRIAVAHEGSPADDGVPGHHHLLLREVDEHVALGVGASEEEEMDLAVPLEDPHRPLEGHGREGGPEGADLGQVLLGLAEVRAELGALVGARGGGELGAQPLDLAGHLAHVVLDALEALPDHGLAGDVVRDHLDVAVGGGVRLVALPVVPVEVGVDDVADGLRRDRRGAARRRARAAEGLEWESTTRTPSSVSMSAVLQLTLYARAATATWTPSATFWTSKRASSPPEQPSIMTRPPQGLGGSRGGGADGPPAGPTPRPV